MREWTPRREKAFQEIAMAMQSAPSEVLESVFAAVNEKIFSIRVRSLILMLMMLACLSICACVYMWF